MGLSFSSRYTPGGSVGFFEGTEKRIEIDFSGDADLRETSNEAWHEVVRLAGTQVLNSKATEGFTSFLLSESSLIVYPRKVIIKTCGNTVPLSSLSFIIQTGRERGLEPEWMCYSRKNFLAPGEQPVEHQSHEREAALCRNILGGVGDAYALGPITGEHWVLYDANFQFPDCSLRGDLTIDVLMYGLPKEVRDVFYTNEPEGSRDGATAMTTQSGLADVAALINAEVDDYCFAPCGYSCNAHAGDAYFMVHVTPQEECSYASFETNFGTSFGQVQSGDISERVNEMITKVLKSFRPDRVTITVFMDIGASRALKGAPFEAAENNCYKRRCFNSHHFESDYIGSVASYISQSSPSAAVIPTSRAAQLPRMAIVGE